MSIELAKRYNAIVVNADSMQVYKYLDRVMFNSKVISSRSLLLPKDFNIFNISPREIFYNGNCYHR